LIVVLEQLAGLGIRDRLLRLGAWAGTSVVAAGLSAVSVVFGLLTYVALLAFAVWRLTGPPR
jgi:hypothetical protein